MFDAEEGEVSGASMNIVIDPNTITQTIKATLSTELEEGTDMKMDIPVEATVKYNYIREGDLLKLTFLNCDVKFDDVILNTEAREAMEANGVDLAEFKTEMKKYQKEGARDAKKEIEKDAKDDTSTLIKSIEENKLILEDTDGETEFIRVK